MKKQFLVIILISLIIIFFQFCKNSTEPNSDIKNISNTITLTSNWQELNSIAVKWNNAAEDTLFNFTYRLIRKDPSGNTFTKDFILTSNDTTYIDNNEGSGLNENTAYYYRIEAANNNEIQDTSNSITIKTLSPSSHNITWEIDTLGQPGDILYDIWGIDENDIWAVGAINMQEGITAVNKMGWV